MKSGFWRQGSGSAVEYFALGGAVVTMLALVIGYSAQQLASNGDLPTIALLGSDQYVAQKPRTPSFNAIDYATTGAIKGQVVVLDPCTGGQKAD